MNLRVRIVRYCCRQEQECWYADIDDADDRQPDDPFWYVDGCRSQRDALSAACSRLTELDHLLATGGRLQRVSGAYVEPDDVAA